MAKLIGEFPDGSYKVSIDGYLVPNVKVYKKTGAEDGAVEVILDGRFSITCAEDEINDWMWLLANAMAIGAGYSSFGANCELANPFKVQIMQLNEEG